MYYNVGIAASSEEPVKEPLKSAVKEFISILTPFKNYIRFIVGGYWGLMKILAEQAREKGFLVIFILPEEPRNLPPRRKEYIILHTDLGYKARSVALTASSDVLVCLGGRIGSIIEVMLAYGFGKPVIILKNYGMDTDNIEKGFGEYIDERKLARLYYVDSGVDAGLKLIEILGLRRKTKEE